MGIALTAAVLTQSITAGGMTRRYGVVVPAHVRKRPALVLVLHGAGQTARGMRQYVRFERASGNAAIVVYPQGYKRHWNDARGAFPAADDQAFLSSLIARMERTYGVDPKRVYVAGFSNGGAMALTAACRMPEVRAVAAVSEDLPASLQNTCRPAHPVSVFVVDGTADPIVPFDGGMVRVLGKNFGEDLSTSATIATFRTIDGCTQTFTMERSPKDRNGTWTAVQTWPQCKSGTAVKLASVQGGGHAWPGAAQYLPRRFIGVANQSFDATRAIWQFFSAH